MSVPAELVVIAAHGPDWITACRHSLRGVDAPVLVVDTGSGTVPDADVRLDGGHPTGAYRWAYEHHRAQRYLFMQDSMAAVVPDPLAWFREQWPGHGAVAWAKFPMQWDASQKPWVQSLYPAVGEPSHGIFGPVFYTDRATLDVLNTRELMPPVPENRLQAQGTERAWAYAFAAAGLPVVGPDWDPDQMSTGMGPFRKTWANRP